MDAEGHLRTSAESAARNIWGQFLAGNDELLGKLAVWGFSQEMRFSFSPFLCGHGKAHFDECPITFKLYNEVFAAECLGLGMPKQNVTYDLREIFSKKCLVHYGLYA